MSTVIWSRNFLRPFLLALMLMGLLLTPTYAFTTGQSATLVIGQSDFTHNVNALTTQTGLYSPFGSVFDALGNLWVADTYHNRVLMFRPPFTNGMAASLVIGHKSFLWDGPATNQTGLNNPSGLGFDALGNLWVSDGNNNRVLMFKPPFTNGMAASLVIGHKSFLWDGPATNQTGLHGPRGVSFDGSGNLWVADYSNSRVLMFKPPFTTGMAATLVIGQAIFTTSAPATSQTGLKQSSGVSFDGSGNLWVADSNSNRVLVFRPPFTNGMAASLVIGQINFNSGSINEGGSTSQTGLSFPFSLSFDLVGNLWVVDTNNNRVLMFPGSTGLSGFLLELQAGWNLISLPLRPTQTATAKLLAPIIQMNDLVTVWGFTPPITWSYFKPPNLGTLTSMVDGKGYWVYVTDAINITIVGYVITPGSAPPTYSLATGWNLLGFKPQPTIQNETVTTYLASIYPKYSTIWVYDNLNATWTKGTPDLALAPGEGMWIYMTTPSTLIPQ
ncbi:MAG: NHL repeat-containing protein [Candidatus Bathyarchaeia archaeon]